MYKSFKRALPIIVIVSLQSSLYGGTLPKEARSRSAMPLLESAKAVKTITPLEQMIREKQELLRKRRKSDVKKYTSIYDEIASLIILKNRRLIETGRSDDIDSDKTCDFALSYGEVEFIKTRYCKTPFDERVAETLKNSAILYEQCHPPMAERYWHSFLKIKEHIYSNESAEAAKAHDLLGDYYRLFMNDFEKAIIEYDQAKKIRERLYGADDIRVTENSGRLALSLYYHGDRNKRAEKLLMESVRLREISPRNPDLPLYRAYMDIGNYDALKGNDTGRIEYYKKAKKSFTGDRKSDYETILEELSTPSSHQPQIPK